ncbi:hypothetical protein EYF80_015908 [Liparis tanakae]|uniref:Uncharacterized protein n=1 Tax=Liparis tanakae TaxID=230148 RepID=A0A4Z2I7W5_9TELE|nr:hypothetical protein EYF80_015908 [Liparis tanakae]
MEGGRMWREEVSFLQADCWMERLRDGQMTMAGRPGPECRLREARASLRVGSGRYAKCTELRPSQRIWQGDPFSHPHPSPASRSPSPSVLPHPSLFFLPSLTPNQESPGLLASWSLASWSLVYWSLVYWSPGLLVSGLLVSGLLVSWSLVSDL